MTRRRDSVPARKGIMEVVTAAMMLAVVSVVAIAFIATATESYDAMHDDTRSKLDLMRECTVEQLDVTATEWRTGKPLSFLVNNFGDYETKYPFLIYMLNGSNVSGNFTYKDMGGNIIGNANSTLYGNLFPSKTSILLVSDGNWDGSDIGLITHCGKQMQVDVS